MGIPIEIMKICLKNNIVSGKSSGDDKELTPEEIRRLISISLYQNSMEPTPFRRQIQNRQNKYIHSI